MNKQEYENIPIIEKVEIYSQTEEGFIFVCTKKDYNVAMFKWKNYYFNLFEIKTVEDIQNNILFEDTISKEEAQELLTFLYSMNKYGFTEFTVLEAALAMNEVLDTN